MQNSVPEGNRTISVAAQAPRKTGALRRLLRACVDLVRGERHSRLAEAAGERFSRPVWLHPAAVWLLVLAAMFVTEYSVMLVLPWLLAPGRSPLLEAAVDAILLISILAPVIWWTVVRPLREVIRLRNRFLADLFARIEADRRHTARELHDGTGQSLSLMVSGLRSVRDLLTDPEAMGRCEYLLKLAGEALTDVKRLALGLRPSVLDDLGLAPALQRLVADLRQQHPLELSLDADDVAGIRLSEAVETAVFRIVQEALANVLTHAGAKSASVTVRRRDDAVTVEVVDDGCGIGTRGEAGGGESGGAGGLGGHLGLTGMRERATLLGGKFAINSAPALGTRLTATIPARG
jgi:signal transduction histidine kinase